MKTIKLIFLMLLPVTLWAQNGQVVNDPNGVVSLTTNGTSGAATLSPNGILNIPIYGNGGGGTGTVTSVGVTGSPSYLGLTVDDPTGDAVLNFTPSAIPNSSLANPSTTVNGQNCVLGAACTITAAPTGTAGGGLSGSYPNPTVSKIGTVTIGNSPTVAGQVPTAQAGLATLLWQTPASNFSPNQNITYLSTNCGLAPNCFPVIGGGHIDTVATWTSGSTTVTTSSEAPVFLPTDCLVGGSGCTGANSKEIYGTGNCVQIQCTLEIPLSSIETYVGPHEVTVSNASNAACTGVQPGNNCFLVWGYDDSVAAIAGFNAAMALNGQLQLPCDTLLFNQPLFISTGNHIYPIGIKGDCAFGSSILVPTPNFSFGSGTNVLFDDLQPFSSIGNNYFENFTVFGAGVIFSTPPPVNSTIMTVQNSYMKNVAFIGLNWNQNVSGYISLGNNSFSGVISEDTGANACLFNSNITYLSNGSMCSGEDAMQINGATLISHGTSWQSFLTLAGTGSVFESSMDTGGVNSNILMSGTGGVLVEDGWLNTNGLGGAITLQNNSIANISNSTLSEVVVESTSILNINNSSMLFEDMLGGTTKALNTTFNNAGASTPAPALQMPSGSPTFIDLGGNTFTSSFTSNVSNVSGSIVSQNMIQGTCTGTATPLSTIFLYGAGSATLTTCTNATQQGGKVMNKAGTLTNLTCTAGTAGLTSDTCTVVKNGTPTALTCTFTSSTCQDTTNAHYITYNPNDIIAIEVTSGAADTLANVGAQVWAQ